jgi:hypothetical protein
LRLAFFRMQGNTGVKIPDEESVLFEGIEVETVYRLHFCEMFKNCFCVNCVVCLLL